MKVDKFKTAIFNGYTEGQARALEMWSMDDFLIFFGEEVVRADGKRVQLVCEDGSLQYYVPKVKTKNIWQKGKYGGEWCLAEEMPDIRSACLSVGKVTMGGYNITLDASGKYLRRRFATS